MSGPGGSSANLSPFFFALSSLMFITEEQVEASFGLAPPGSSSAYACPVHHYATL
jgi:hypothetical protein